MPTPHPSDHGQSPDDDDTAVLRALPKAQRGVPFHKRITFLAFATVLFGAVTVGVSTWMFLMGWWPHGALVLFQLALTAFTAALIRDMLEQRITESEQANRNNVLYRHEETKNDLLAAVTTMGEATLAAIAAQTETQHREAVERYQQLVWALEQALPDLLTNARWQAYQQLMLRRSGTESATPAGPDDPEVLAELVNLADRISSKVRDGSLVPPLGARKPRVGGS